MLDPKEEKRFDELKNMCRELKVPAPPEIMIGLQVHEGGVLTFDDLQRGHSWNRNFWNSLFAGFNYPADSYYTNAPFGAGYIYWKLINGTTDSYGWACGQGTYQGEISTARGIVVGTSSAAFTAGDYALGTIIAPGNSSGQLAYNAQNIPTYAYNGGTKIWTSTKSRIFNNNSGGSITVAETGLYCYSSGATGTFMIERSVLSPTVAVAKGAQLTVTYEISMDFSAID